jgi:hypothetical protein
MTIADRCAVFHPDIRLQTYPDCYELSIVDKDGRPLVKRLPHGVNDGELSVALDALAWHATEARAHRSTDIIEDKKRVPLDWDG